MQPRIVILLSVFVYALHSVEPALQNLSQSLQLFEQQTPWLMGECFSVAQKERDPIIKLHERSCIPIGGTDYAVGTIISEIVAILRKHVRPDISTSNSNIDWTWQTPKVEDMLPFYLENIPKEKYPDALLKQFAIMILYHEKVNPGSFFHTSITNNLSPQQQKLWQECQTDIASYLHQKKRYYLKKLSSNY